jgi:hypothetical protein
MATKCTAGTMRLRCVQLAPMVFEGLKMREIRERAAKNPKLRWVATLSDRTMHTYTRRVAAMAVDSAPLRTEIVTEVLDRLAETRRQLDRLEAKLRAVGVGKP